MLALWISIANPFQTPEEALQSFYSQNGAEDMLMDPLILAGDKVVPLVINEVKSPDMPRRRYAILFLGNDKYINALPVLEQILADNSEKDYFRGDALISIYKIDNISGKKLAASFANNEGYLGLMSKAVLGGSEYANKRRSYIDALRGWHE
jgi:hypothetical protein